MTCPDVEPFLLDPQLDAETQAHLDSCAECRAIRAELMDSQTLLRAHMDTPAPPAMRTAFYSMLGDLQNAQRTPTGWRSWVSPRVARPLRWAVAFVAVFALGAVSMSLLQGRSGPGAEVNGVLSQLEDASPTMRLTGVYTISDEAATQEQVREALVALIQTDPSVNVRVAALEALAPSLPHADVRTAVVQVLGSDPEPLVQLAALRALESHTSPEVRQALDELLETPDLEPLIREHVRSILL
ncbi:MAG: HEAT repeat domain-containing protein [Bacteroidota bacterium]